MKNTDSRKGKTSKDKKSKNRAERRSADRPTRRPKQKGSVTKAVAAREASGVLNPRQMRRELIRLGVLVPAPRTF